MDARLETDLQELRRLVATGQYRVDPDAVAEAIVRRVQRRPSPPRRRPAAPRRQRRHEPTLAA
jgi:hypothetical protein